MKLDTSSYYPKSPLDDDPEEEITPAEQAVQTAQAVQTVQHSEPEVADTDHEYVDGYDPGQPEGEAGDIFTGVSTFLSWALVPLLMPVYGCMLAFGLSILSFTGFSVRLTFTLIVAAFNVLVPAVLVVILKRFGMVHDLGLNGQKERLIPYLICIICLVGTALFMSHRGAPLWLVMFFYGGAVAGAIEVIVNLWWKISVHAAGIAGIVALTLHLLLHEFCVPSTFVWFLVTVALAGLLGSARIWLGRHTLGQVLAGYVVGFTSVYLMMLI